MSLFGGLDKELSDDTKQVLAALAQDEGAEVALIHALFHYVKQRFDSLDQAIAALGTGPTTLEITPGKPKDK